MENGLGASETRDHVMSFYAWTSGARDEVRDIRLSTEYSEI